MKPIKAWAVIDKDGGIRFHSEIWGSILNIATRETSLDLHRHTDKIIPVLISPLKPPKKKVNKTNANKIRS